MHSTALGRVKLTSLHRTVDSDPHPRKWPGNAQPENEEIPSHEQENDSPENDEGEEDGEGLDVELGLLENARRRRELLKHRLRTTPRGET